METHPFGFYEWFEREGFPNFTSPEGQLVLRQRSDEIVGAINMYFTPGFMARTAGARYLREDVERVRDAYEKPDLWELGIALENFRLACRVV